ncbi:MAG: c-type cytochrome biogenesis protein CcsB [Desulfobacterales bacterium CG23_combo_of_CG06-09_8_20_14_all_52_9]|nr:MAG: c-type cytochrome biogenesis protein CcsB [Desulfobacterales bacterium CG23_combo_of_CG06-09_8_20_14_all_52_9]
MTSSLILSVITFIYGFSAALYVASWIFKKASIGKAATWITLAAVVGHVAGILLRWVESYQMGIGHAPLSNFYESIVFFSWTLAVIYLVVERAYQNRVIGAFVAPIAFLAMAYASLSPNINDRIQPLVPALKSNWLIAHVIACFVGYAAFGIAFGISLMYLIKHSGRDRNSRLLALFPEQRLLEALNHQMIMFGFLFLSIGIITGSVWANSAWGSYWSWDPKETWSLITWFIYATLLHARMMRGWHGKRLAYISIIGFGAVLFTYFGVNLLPGLHSYSQ